MKKLLIVVVVMLLIVGGGITAYKYIETQKDALYTNGMFVDRGANDGYAEVYDLCAGL